MAIIITEPSLAWTYSDLQTKIGTWLHRSDLTASIPDFIRLAEARIYRKLRIRAMETAFSSVIASGVIAVPTSYVELKHARVDGSPTGKLARKNDEWIYQNYPTRSSSGKPKFIAREADNFIFGPYPDSTYTIKGIYYKRLAALSVSTTNWFTENAPDLLLFAALCEAAPYLGKDSRIVIWEGKFNAVIDQIQRENDAEEFSGSPPQMTAR